MDKIRREELLTLEAYSKSRQEFRKQVMEHKKARRVQLGENVTLHFEDRLTIHYQIQEMLRAERTFEDEGIQHELDAYNPLIPDGKNLKATMMIEYPDPSERQKQLAALRGIEDLVWVQVEGCEKVFAIADEDLERENDEKTSSVHFLRFEFNDEMAGALKYGVGLSMGVIHPEYLVETDVPADVRGALAKDMA